jgi:hypothetical protein
MSAQRQVSSLTGPDQAKIGNPISAFGVEWKIAAANTPEAIQQQKSTRAIQEHDRRTDSVEDISSVGIQEVKSPSPTINTHTDAIDRRLDLESAAPMSGSALGSPPSDKGSPGLDPKTHVVAASTPPKLVPKVSGNPGPRLPSSFAPPPAAAAPPAPPAPPPPRPTQLPYHELKKNPEFKALSRKYTSLIVAIPIALFTSYVLWGRCKFDFDLDSLMPFLKRNSQIPIGRLIGD